MTPNEPNPSMLINRNFILYCSKSIFLCNVFIHYSYDVYLVFSFTYIKKNLISYKTFTANISLVINV